MQAKGLRTLLQTLVFSLPALVNVGSVLFLFMFIFAIVGMSLFGNTRYGEYLNQHANFDSFPSALLLLIRITTGESWNGLMRDCMLSTQCVSVKQSFTNSAGVLVPASQDTWYNPGDSFLDGAPSNAIGDHCGPWKGLAVAYFMLFVVLCGFLLLNLVIAVILDNFQNSSSNEELEVSQSNILQFSELWGKLDTKTTLYIPAARLTQLLESLDPPLGTVGLAHVQLEVQDIIMGSDIPIRTVHGAPHVQFSEVLHALAGRIAGCELPVADELKARAQYTGIVSLRGMITPKYGAAHYHAGEAPSLCDRLALLFVFIRSQETVPCTVAVLQLIACLIRENLCEGIC
jgi:Ion transport protein